MGRRDLQKTLNSLFERKFKMEKLQFMEFVRSTIKENPEWFGDTISYINLAVQQRLTEERDKRVEAEYALAMAHPAINDKKLGESHKSAINKVLKSSKAFAGTSYAEKLEI